MNYKKILPTLILGVQIFFAPLCYANSYLTMITTPPQNYEPYTPPHLTQPQNNLYHQPNIITSSPVVTDPTHKIAAWEYSQSHPFSPLSIKEDIQDIIFALETIALGGIIYLIYKH